MEASARRAFGRVLELQRQQGVPRRLRFLAPATGRLASSAEKLRWLLRAALCAVPCQLRHVAKRWHPVQRLSQSQAVVSLPSFDDVEGLIALWQQPAAELAYTPAAAEGKVLVPAQPFGEVASRDVFLQRFHERTGGLFKDMHWRNLRAIGGMVLACLVADDADFARCFPETDVDIYAVGISGKDFEERMATAAVELCEKARGMGLQATLLRTPCTVTLSLRDKDRPLPNVQFVLGPFESTKRLLFTTDIDCTGLGFDGKELLATPWARDALKHRRNLARPEKYAIRGEYASECRLFKYATRGFQAVDPGLPEGVQVPDHFNLASLAAEAGATFLRLSSDEDSLAVEAKDLEKRVRATGVTGAQLLLFAEKYPGLRQLMSFDAPLLPAGLSEGCLQSLLRRREAFEDGYAHVDHGRLKVLRAGPGESLGAVVRAEVQEMDVDARPEVRSWYTGLEVPA